MTVPARWFEKAAVGAVCVAMLYVTFRFENLFFHVMTMMAAAGDGVHDIPSLNS